MRIGTATIEKLAAEASSKGFTVTRDGGVTRIAMLTPKRKSVARGVYIYEDGTVFDLTVSPSVAKCIGSIADVRKVLKL